LPILGLKKQALVPQEAIMILNETSIPDRKKALEIFPRPYLVAVFLPGKLWPVWE
jgi:hypothetical protein